MSKNKQSFSLAITPWVSLLVLGWIYIFYIATPNDGFQSEIIHRLSTIMPVILGMFILFIVYQLSGVLFGHKKIAINNILLAGFSVAILLIAGIGIMYIANFSITSWVIAFIPPALILCSPSLYDMFTSHKMKSICKE